MANSTQKFLTENFLAIVVILQVAMYISLFLDFPIVRQVVGIAYLIFVPGLIFIRLIKLDELGTLESIVFAVGFSVAFLMLSGLIINQFGYVVGLSFPLSTLPLSLFINTVIIVGAAVAHLRQGKIKKADSIPNSIFNPSLLLLTLIPALSLIGVYFVNTTGNSLILVAMILSIAALIAVTAFRERSSKFYAFAICMIALALLLQASMVSNYIVPYGGDSPAEYYVFQTVQTNSHWNPVFAFPYRSRVRQIQRHAQRHGSSDRVLKHAGYGSFIGVQICLPAHFCFSACRIIPALATLHRQKIQFHSCLRICCAVNFFYRNDCVKPPDDR